MRKDVTPDKVLSSTPSRQEEVMAGKMFQSCGPVSEGKAKCLAIAAQPNHQVVPLLRLRKAPRPTHSPLHPGPQRHGFALAFLRVFLPPLGLLGLAMPLVGAPSIRVNPREATGVQQLLPPQEDVVLPPAAPLRPYLPRVGSQGVPPPTRLGFFAPLTPPGIAFGAASTTPLKRIRTPACHCHVRGMQGRQHAMMPRLQLRRCFFRSLRPVVGLTGKTRAGARLPRACMAMATLGCCTSGAGPA